MNNQIPTFSAACCISLLIGLAMLITPKSAEAKNIRLVINKTATCGKSQNVAIKKLEFQIDGIWQKNIFTKKKGFIGDYPAMATASSTYKRGYPWRALNIDKKSWSSAKGTYLKSRKFKKSRSWLKIRFEDDVAITGYRLLGPKKCSPRDFYLEESLDGGKKWTKIAGSRRRAANTGKLYKVELKQPQRSCGPVAHGETTTRSAFVASTVPYGQECPTTTETGVCDNGVVRWNDRGHSSCTYEPAASCADGVNHGQSIERVAFKSSTVPYGQACERVIETGSCINGSMTWSGHLPSSCVQEEPAGCEGGIDHGEELFKTVYTAEKSTPFMSCQTEERKGYCLNGTIEWDNSGFETCEESELKLGRLDNTNPSQVELVFDNISINEVDNITWQVVDLVYGYTVLREWQNMGTMFPMTLGKPWSSTPEFGIRAKYSINGEEFYSENEILIVPVVCESGDCEDQKVVRVYNSTELFANIDVINFDNREDLDFYWEVINPQAPEGDKIVTSVAGNGLVSMREFVNYINKGYFLQARVVENGEEHVSINSLVIKDNSTCGDLNAGDRTSRMAYDAKTVPLGETCRKVTQYGSCSLGEIVWDKGAFEKCTINEGYQPDFEIIEPSLSLAGSTGDICIDSQYELDAEQAGYRCRLVPFFEAASVRGTNNKQVNGKYVFDFDTNGYDSNRSKRDIYGRYYIGPQFFANPPSNYKRWNPFNFIYYQKDPLSGSLKSEMEREASRGEQNPRIDVNLEPDEINGLEKATSALLWTLNRRWEDVLQCTDTAHFSKKWRSLTKAEKIRLTNVRNDLLKKPNFLIYGGFFQKGEGDKARAFTSIYKGRVSSQTSQGFDIHQISFNKAPIVNDLASTSDFALAGRAGLIFHEILHGFGYTHDKTERNEDGVLITLKDVDTIIYFVQGCIENQIKENKGYDEQDVGQLVTYNELKSSIDNSISKTLKTKLQQQFPAGYKLARTQDRERKCNWNLQQSGLESDWAISVEDVRVSGSRFYIDFRCSQAQTQYHACGGQLEQSSFTSHSGGVISGTFSVEPKKVNLSNIGVDVEAGICGSVFTNFLPDSIKTY